MAHSSSRPDIGIAWTEDGGGGGGTGVAGDARVDSEKCIRIGLSGSVKLDWSSSVVLANSLEMTKLFSWHLQVKRSLQ